MLINALNHSESVDTSICIIGSGVGGGTLVHKIAQQNRDFVVIEAGDLKGNSNIVGEEVVGIDFAVKTHSSIRSHRSIQLGGTSNLWHGVLAPLDKIDFEKRDWIPYSGWPVTLTDLEPYYQQAAEILRVKEFDYFQEDGLPASLRDKLKDIRFDGGYLKNKLFQQPLPPTNFKHIVIEAVAKSPNRHCYYNAVVLELITDQDGKKIDKLLVSTGNNKTFEVRADQFIIAAGALETPRLLLNSKRTQKKGLGNGSDKVGRFLMNHPMGNLCQVQFLQPQKAPIYSTFKYRDDMKITSGLEMTNQFQKKLRLPNHNFYLRPSFIKGIDNRSEQIKLSLLACKDGGVTFRDVWQVVTHINVIRQILTYKLSLNVTFKYADLFFLTEQIPNPNSTVSLSDKKDQFDYPIAKINWQLLPEDIASVRVWYELLIKEIFPKEYFKFTHTLKDFDWDNIFIACIHHVGTARMADNEQQGVVDRNLKVFGVDNLYVCDGSIFTTAGNANISFTISAFACRLSDYLLNCKKI